MLIKNERRSESDNFGRKCRLLQKFNIIIVFEDRKKLTDMFKISDYVLVSGKYRLNCKGC